MLCFSSISVDGVERTAIRWPISCQRFPVARQKKEGGKKSVDRKKRRKKKKKSMAYTSKNCRHFFTKDYRRFFNTTSIQTRLQRPILVNVYDRYIHTRERSFPRKELAITWRYDHFERNWIPYKGGNYTEKREMDWHTYRESCWKKIIFETR